MPGAERGLPRCPPAAERKGSVWEEGNSPTEFQPVPIDRSVRLRLRMSTYSNDHGKQQFGVRLM